MAARDRAPRRWSDRDRRRALSASLDLIDRGETVLTLIDPETGDRATDAYGRWLSARLTIAQLPRLLLPPCDERCHDLNHGPDDHVVLSDLALDLTPARPVSWWTGWNETLQARHAAGPMYYAGAPAMPLTPTDRRLPAGTRLRRLTTTDPAWVAYDGMVHETLFAVTGGAFAGWSVVAATFGQSPLLPALAGALIAPDHPPVHDANVAVRILAAGWAAVERGLPYEEA